MAINQMDKYRLKANEYLKLIITVLSVLLFLFTYDICEYFYPDSDASSIKGWWYLKVDIYLFLVGVCILIASMDKQKDKDILRLQKIITSIGVGFAFSNVIDRRIFNEREFGVVDLIIIVTIVLVSQINLKRIKHQAINDAKTFYNDRTR